VIEFKSANMLLALTLVVTTLVLFIFVVVFRVGGDNALFLIIGHTAAWVEIVVLFFFRKAPPSKKE